MDKNNNVFFFVSGLIVAVILGLLVQTEVTKTEPLATYVVTYEAAITSPLYGARRETTRRDEITFPAGQSVNEAYVNRRLIDLLCTEYAAEELAPGNVWVKILDCRELATNTSTTPAELVP